MTYYFLHLHLKGFVFKKASFRGSFEESRTLELKVTAQPKASSLLALQRLQQCGETLVLCLEKPSARCFVADATILNWHLQRRCGLNGLFVAAATVWTYRPRAERRAAISCLSLSRAGFASAFPCEPSPGISSWKFPHLSASDGCSVNLPISASSGGKRVKGPRGDTIAALWACNVRPSTDNRRFGWKNRISRLILCQA